MPGEIEQAQAILERVKRGEAPPSPMLAHEWEEREAHDRRMRAFAITTYATASNVSYTDPDFIHLIKEGK